MNVKGHQSKTALHFACAKGNIDMVECFITVHKANPYARDDKCNTAINVAALNGHRDLVNLLVNRFKCNPLTQGFNGRTPLHQACVIGSSELLKLLVVEHHCDVITRDDCGNTPIHVAALYGHIGLIRELVQYGSLVAYQNDKGLTPLHFAAEKGHEEAVDVLISDFDCNPNIGDGNGNTPLHYAVKRGNPNLVKKLLMEYKVSSAPRNNEGLTPLHFAIQKRHVHVVSELVKHNCNPSIVDKEYRQLEQSSSKRLSEGSLTKVFVIGNKQVGKSTLVEALRNENQKDPSFTKKVIPHTAGIVPSVHESSQYGRVLFYDFAGDPEYYSSHAAALERLLTSSCHIFLLVVDLSEDDGVILQKLGYWLTFVSYNSKSQKARSQVIVVGSHTDVVESMEGNAEDRACFLFMERSSSCCGHLAYIETVGYCTLDCRESQSAGIRKLYGLLKHIHLRSKSEQSGDVSVGASILLGVLERYFKGQIACQVSKIRTHIEFNEVFLPLEVHNVYSYLQELNAHGVILILGNREGLNEEWVVLDISKFLSTVHKKLLSPSALSRICTRRITNLGIIAESDLGNILSDYDAQLLKQCLKHLHYCIEVDDSEVLQKMFEFSPPMDSNPKFLFFPALLRALESREDLTWGSIQESCSCKGWYMKCCKDYDYFSARFLHVLLLRLALDFALPLPDSERSGSISDHYSRRCICWKNGIHWMGRNGIECVVEVVKQNKGVLVMVRGSQDMEVECGCVLAAVVEKVLDARQEFCHSLVASMYLVDPHDMRRKVVPTVEELHLFDISEVKQALKEPEGDVMIVSVDGRRYLPAAQLRRHNMWSKFLSLQWMLYHNIHSW